MGAGKPSSLFITRRPTSPSVLLPGNAKVWMAGAPVLKTNWERVRSPGDPERTSISSKTIGCGMRRIRGRRAISCRSEARNTSARTLASTPRGGSLTSAGPSNPGGTRTVTNPGRTVKISASARISKPPAMRTNSTWKLAGPPFPVGAAISSFCQSWTSGAACPWLIIARNASVRMGGEKKPLSSVGGFPITGCNGFIVGKLADPVTPAT